MLTTTAGYVLEHVGRLVLTVLVGILVARHLGPARLGSLAFLQASLSMVAPFVMLGMQPALVRELSSGSAPGPTLRSALRYQVPVGLAAVMVIPTVLYVVANPNAQERATLLVMAPLPLMAIAGTFRASLEARAASRAILVAGFAAGGVAAAIRLGAIGTHAPLWTFGAAYTLEAAVLLTGYVIATRVDVGALLHRDPGDRSQSAALARESWPLIVAGLAVSLYMRADIVMLGFLSTEEETGLYTAVARISEAGYFVPTAALAAIRPVLARYYSDGDQRKYTKLTEGFAAASGLVSMVAVTAVFVLSSRLIDLVYGSDYAGAGKVLQIHILAAPFVFLGVAGSQWFIDRKLQRLVLVYSTVGAGSNVVLNLFLIPRYGAKGAAIATVVAYGIVILLNAASSKSRALFRIQLRALNPVRWIHIVSTLVRRIR